MELIYERETHLPHTSHVHRIPLSFIIWNRKQVWKQKKNHPRLDHPYFSKSLFSAPFISSITWFLGFLKGAFNAVSWSKVSTFFDIFGVFCVSILCSRQSRQTIVCDKIAAKSDDALFPGMRTQSSSVKGANSNTVFFEQNRQLVTVNCIWFGDRYFLCRMDLSLFCK